MFVVKLLILNAILRIKLKLLLHGFRIGYAFLHVFYTFSKYLNLKTTLSPR